MKNRQRTALLNVIAFSALAFAIYFSFFYRDKPFEAAPPQAANAVEPGH
jgi:hypothetical protein